MPSNFTYLDYDLLIESYKKLQSVRPGISFKHYCIVNRGLTENEYIAAKKYASRQSIKLSCYSYYVNRVKKFPVQIVFCVGAELNEKLKAEELKVKEDRSKTIRRILNLYFNNEK